MSRWHAVLCKPRREAAAEANLKNQGFEVHLPRVVGLRRKAGRWAQVVEPLFPRYLFLNARDGSQSIAPVRSTPGVTDLVRFCGRPAVVPSGVVEALQRAVDPETGCHQWRAVRFAPGDGIRFVEGPFKGLDGVFEMESGVSVSPKIPICENLKFPTP